MVGFSMGGGEVARFQTKYPGRTSAAVLISAVVPYMLKTDDNPEGVPQATFDEMTAGMKADREHFFTGFFKDFYGVGSLSSPVSDEVLMNSWRQTMLSGTHNMLAAAKASPPRFPPRSCQLRCPTLVIHGTADKTVPIDATGRVSASQIAGAKLIEYDGSAHGLFATDKQRLIDDVVGFLDANVATGSDTRSAIPLNQTA